MSLVIYDIVINSEVYTFSCPDRFILKINTISRRNKNQL